MFRRAIDLGLPTALQILLQTIPFATSFLLIRSLPIADFAIYSAFLVLSQVLVSSCDLGAVSSIGYFYKRVERRIEPFARYFRAVVQVRSVLFLIVAIIVYPAFLYGSSLGQQIGTLPVLIAISLAISIAQASYGTTATALRFVSEKGVVTALCIEIVASLSRLALIALVILLLELDSAQFALAVTAVIAVAQALATRAILHRHVPQDPVELPVPRRDVISYVLPIIPGGLYHSAQPLILPWLAAQNGGLRQIAEIGVLGRIGLIFGVLSFIVSFQIMPMLGRAENRAAFLRIYVISAITLVTGLGCVLIAALLLAPQIMWLAGEKYSDLQAYLPLALGAAILTVISGFASSVLRLEGWNRFEPWCTAMQIAGQVGWLLLVPIDTTRDLLIFSLFSAVLYCAPYVALNVLGFLSPSAFNVPVVAK